MENIGYLGSVVGLVGVIWTAVIAFQKSDVLWGIFILLCPGIVALIYGAMNFQQTKVPTILVIIGIVTQGFFGLRLL